MLAVRFVRNIVVPLQEKCIFMLNQVVRIVTTLLQTVNIVIKALVKWS